MPTCPACRNEIPPRADPCPHCGAGLNWPSAPLQGNSPPPPSRTLAVLSKEVERAKKELSHLKGQRPGQGRVPGFVVAIFFLLVATVVSAMEIISATRAVQQEISTQAGLGPGVAGLGIGLPGALILVFLLVTRGGHKKKYADYEQRVAACQQTLDGLLADLNSMTEVRKQKLLQISRRDLQSLIDFQPYVVSESPMAIYPGQGSLPFSPGKGEVVLLQANSVTLSRFKIRAQTQKVGGGYRVFGVYVPVEKQRVQFTEMERRDTGVLAVTDKRILFLGKVKKLTVRFDQILELDGFIDAIAVTKEGRQSADYFIGIDGPLANAVIHGMR